ncbi:MAG: DUF4382 domain-containing protein [Candidatus Woesearchaeota archaeon]
MKWINTIGAVFAMLVLMSFSVTAQPELTDPGITPDSPFYFMDRMFDGFQSAESLADERAAEMTSMAEENKEKAFEKAREGYDKAMEKREKEAEESEENAEKVARQASNHMAVLAKLREQVPEQARAGIDRAMNESAQGREKALESLKEKNPEKAESVAKATLEEVLANAPEAAKAGLKRALEAQGTKGGAQSGENGGYASGEVSPEDIPANQDKQGTDENKTEEARNEMSNQTKDSDSKETPADEAQGGENFRMLVSDAPADIADFDYLNVHIGKTRIINGNEEGFEERDVDVTVDLTELVGAASTEVLETELEPGVYSKIELYVKSVDATVGNESAQVMVPSEKLQIVKEFEIVEGNVTTFVFDINVVRKGQGNEYNLLPVISESGVVGKDLDESEVEEIEDNETEEEKEKSENETEEAECTTDTDCETGYECVNEECEEIETEESEENQTTTA